MNSSDPVTIWEFPGTLAPNVQWGDPVRSALNRRQIAHTTVPVEELTVDHIEATTRHIITDGWVTATGPEREHVRELAERLVKRTENGDAYAVGISAGSQILAQAAKPETKVQVPDLGPEYGIVSVQTREQTFRVATCHRHEIDAMFFQNADVVLEGWNGHTTIQAWSMHNRRLVGIQFHPELTVADLIASEPPTTEQFKTPTNTHWHLSANTFDYFVLQPLRLGRHHQR